MEILHTNEKFINQNKPCSRKYQQQWQQKYKDREATWQNMTMKMEAVPHYTFMQQEDFGPTISLATPTMSIVASRSEMQSPLIDCSNRILRARNIVAAVKIDCHWSLC
jgi:hypothetical protein